MRVMEAPALEPIGIDRPSSARMYDYFLGGSHNFEVDRAAAHRVIAGFPGITAGMRANRAFLRRAVRFLVEQGVDQFLDLGSGIPTAGNVHEVAQRCNPRARVVYVDVEPIAVQHSLALLAGNAGATAVRADLRFPARVLELAQVRGLLDFSRPVAVLIVGTLHFVADADDPAGIVAGYRRALAPGSYLVLTNGTGDEQPPEEVAAAVAVYAHSPTPLTLRDRAAMLAIFDGVELVEPGLVGVARWRPDQLGDAQAAADYPFAWVGVGRTS